MSTEKLLQYAPAVVDAAVSLIEALDKRSTKDEVAARVRLRRAVDAERIRREAVVKAKPRNAKPGPSLYPGLRTGKTPEKD